MLLYNLICCNMYIAHFQQMNIRFFLSTVPFCFGMYGVVVYFKMPFSLQNLLKFLMLYSPPPSHLIALNFFQSDFLPNFEYLKLVKHTKFSLHGINKPSTWGYFNKVTIHTCITKIQVMISIEIHAFNKVISFHGY